MGELKILLSMPHKLQNKIKYKTSFFYNEKACGLLATISLCLLENLHIRSGFDPRSCLIKPQKEHDALVK